MIVFSWAVDRPYWMTVTGSRRAVDRATKRLHAELGEYWHKHFMPEHFKKGAVQKYGYQERTEEYVKRRAKKLHISVGDAAQSALRWSGNMQRLAKNKPIIKAYPSRFTVRMQGDEYITMTPRPPSRGGRRAMPALGKELTAITQGEADTLGKIAQKRFPTLLLEETKRKQSRKRKVIA